MMEYDNANANADDDDDVVVDRLVPMVRMAMMSGSEYKTAGGLHKCKQLIIFQIATIAETKS